VNSPALGGRKPSTIGGGSGKDNLIKVIPSGRRNWPLVSLSEEKNWKCWSTLFTSVENKKGGDFWTTLGGAEKGKNKEGGNSEGYVVVKQGTGLQAGHSKGQKKGTTF